MEDNIEFELSRYDAAIVAAAVQSVIEKLCLESTIRPALRNFNKLLCSKIFDSYK